MNRRYMPSKVQRMVGPPGQSLTLDSEGNLMAVQLSASRRVFGKRLWGGFEVSPNGTETALYDFTGGLDGCRA